MSKLFNVSSSPHVRSKMTTRSVMVDVVLALLPATVMGIYAYGMHAALVILASIITAVLCETIFNYIIKKPNTAMDCSAVVTGLLLALCLPPSVPLYVPIIGSMFAIIVVKCLFGGLGKNFMNPALAGRCFLILSFSIAVTTFKVDGVSMATPLADLANGEAVNLTSILVGTSNGVLGSSALGLIVGGLYLWAIGGITIEIPAAAILSFTLFIALFGGQGFDPLFLLTHIAAGGILMGAIFMATDPVTSPVTSKGQIVFGCIVGLLSGLFRVFGSAQDSVSYAIIISNMFVPLIDEHIVPVPYGNRPPKAEGEKGFSVPKAAVTLCVITLIAGVALSGVFAMTKDTIAEQKAAAELQSYKDVCPVAETFEFDDNMSAAIASLEGGVYGTDFGKAYIKQAAVGKDASGNTVGYVVSATSGDGFDGTLTVSVGFEADGTIIGVAFTELHETAGMGMECEKPAFKGQFEGKNVDKFVLNKAGGSTEPEQIDTVSGASITSSAVVNAVNAAVDFIKANM